MLMLQFHSLLLFMAHLFLYIFLYFVYKCFSFILFFTILHCCGLRLLLLLLFRGRYSLFAAISISVFVCRFKFNNGNLCKLARSFIKTHTDALSFSLTHSKWEREREIRTITHTVVSEYNSSTKEEYNGRNVLNILSRNVCAATGALFRYENYEWTEHHYNSGKQHNYTHAHTKLYNKVTAADVVADRTSASTHSLYAVRFFLVLSMNFSTA